MNDMENESIAMRLDKICKKLYEKAKPRIAYNSDALCVCDISDKIDLLEKMIDAWWGLETEKSILQSENHRIIRDATNKIQSLERERDKHFQSWAGAEEKIGKLEDILRQYQDKPYEKQEAQASVEPKTKRGNQNATRKDIDPVEVYRLVKGGMSISKVAEKYHASRATIRKYYIVGENECSEHGY